MSHNTESVTVVARQKGTAMPWKPMPQIKVDSVNDAIKKIRRASIVLKASFDFAVRSVVLYIDDDICDHGVAIGDWCEPCNLEYKAAAKVSDHAE